MQFTFSALAIRIDFLFGPKDALSLSHYFPVALCQKKKTWKNVLSQNTNREIFNVVGSRLDFLNSNTGPHHIKRFAPRKPNLPTVITAPN